MKQFNIRVARNIVTYETIDFSAEQYNNFMQWYEDVSGEDFDEENIDPNYLNDYVLEMDIATSINEDYSQTEVDFINRPDIKKIVGVITAPKSHIQQTIELATKWCEENQIK